VEKLVAQVGARGAVLRIDKVAPLLIGKPVLGTLRPDVFAQVNAASNALLVAAAMERLRPAGGLRVLELYCGSGNFTLPAMAAGAQVVAVESAGPALGLLRDAAEKRGLRGQLRIMEGDALKLSQALAGEGQRFEACLLDPPRAGASGLGPSLRALGVERVVYVSCDPATLARDVGELRGAGFKAVWAQPFDLFPQTPHVEGLVLLEKSS
jgi:23S rRNA (uracil1939-C5)-methyltransferase